MSDQFNCLLPGKETERDRKFKNQIQGILAERFPLCFPKKGEPKKPLAIGIGDKILLEMPELTNRGLRVALVAYTAGPAYCRCMIMGHPRYDLDGKTRGTVSQREADFAKMRLDTVLKEKSAASRDE